MKVEAVRDDGALLITSGQAALLYHEGRTWLTSRNSALTRGDWAPSSEPIPDGIPGEQFDALNTYRAELDTDPLQAQ